MKSLGKMLATTALVMGLGMTLGTSAAYADGCSGRDHSTETILGAGAGALAGGLIGGDLAGAAVGGVAGGFIGNAVGRSQDCNRARRQAAARRPAVPQQAYYVDRSGQRHYYQR